MGLISMMHRNSPYWSSPFKPNHGTSGFSYRHLAAWSWVEKCVKTSAPLTLATACSVSIGTAVWMVMWIRPGDSRPSAGLCYRTQPASSLVRAFPLAEVGGRFPNRLSLNPNCIKSTFAVTLEFLIKLSVTF